MDKLGTLKPHHIIIIIFWALTAMLATSASGSSSSLPSSSSQLSTDHRNFDFSLSGASLRDAFSSTTRIVDAGTSLSLKCVATGNPLPQVTWTLDGSSLHEPTSRLSVGDFVTKSNEVVSYVNISSISVEDGGVYSCQAVNELSSTVHSGRIDVKGHPVVRPMKDRVAMEGSCLMVTCPYSGHPIDEVYWEHNNRRLPYNHRQRSFPNGSLLIDLIDRRSDGGEYRCVVKSGLKSASKSVKVSVESPPVIEPFSFPRYLEEGSRGKILCSVIKGDPPITISWLKDGKSLSSSSLTGLSISTLDEFSSAIVISKVTLGHRGNYTCIASNSASSSNYTAEAVVYAPPKWTVEPTDAIAIHGREVVISCMAEGFPDPVIEWRKSSSRSGLSPFRAVSFDGRFTKLDNNSLEVRHVDKLDEGYYMCKASNGLGSGISTVVQLKVRIPAHFKEEFRVETVAKSSRLIVRCEAFGDKPLTIKWRKDGQSLSAMNGSSSASSLTDSRYKMFEVVTEEGLTSEIKVDSADRRDSSLYTCTTSNAYGSDEINLQVIVQEKPDAPVKATITRVDSRSLSISWSHPYSGNSPIIYYVVEYKESNEDWMSSTSFDRSIRVSGSETRAKIDAMNPGTSYNVRLYAENAIGRSDPGPTLQAITEIEAPNESPTDVTADPLGSRAIRVTWRTPSWISKSQVNLIKGYYVGFRPAHSPHAPFSYKTIEVTNNTINGGHFEAVISNLDKLTKYVIVVKAFNRKGSGPTSSEVYVKTNDLDIPPAPVLELVSSSHKSIDVRWEISGEGASTSPTMKPSMTGFSIFIREEAGLWKEVFVNSENTRRFTFTDLNSGTRYQIYLTAHNEAGSGLPSNTISVRTRGTDGVFTLKPDILSKYDPNHHMISSGPSILVGSITPIVASLSIAILILVIACILCGNKAASSSSSVLYSLRRNTQHDSSPSEYLSNGGDGKVPFQAVSLKDLSSVPPHLSESSRQTPSSVEIESSDSCLSRIPPGSNCPIYSRPYEILPERLPPGSGSGTYPTYSRPYEVFPVNVTAIDSVTLRRIHAAQAVAASNAGIDKPSTSTFQVRGAVYDF